MTSNGGDSVFPKPQATQSGVKTVLQYTGIPPSWLDKRPGLPSRNWLIFLTVTSAVTGYYMYDRRQCKKIRQEYTEKVRNLATQPLGTMDHLRKVTVYGAKWLGDEDYDRSMRYFRKYVKPILVAAAVDYDMIKGRRFGDLTRRVADEIRSERRLMLGIDQPPINPMQLPGSSYEAKSRRKVEGGIVIIGRHTLKEYMAGLKRGWTDGLEKVDREEELSRALENDGKFDELNSEPAVDSTVVVGDDEPIPTPSRLLPSKPFSVLAAPNLRVLPQPPKKTEVTIPPHLNVPPATIPPQPPMLLVNFTNHIGLTQIPLMIWDFFHERNKVYAGAEAAYKLIMGNTRLFSAPPTRDLDAFDLEQPQKPYMADLSPTDLDFDREGESYYKKSTVRDFLTEIEKARKEYYNAIVKKLETARALARGTREPTKEERNYPPPTEVELRAERLKKELRWADDEEGFRIITPESDVVWDERFRDVLRVYTVPSEEQSRLHDPSRSS